MPSQEDILTQQERLEIHRRNLSNYLKQQEILGRAYATPGITNGIREARDEIARIKRTLRDWGVTVEDLPDDEEVPDIPPVRDPQGRAYAPNASTQNLARPRHQSRVRVFRVRPEWLLLGGGGCFVALLLGINWLAEYLSNKEIIPFLPSGEPNPLLLGLIALGVSAIAAVWTYQNSDLQVRIFEDGIEHQKNGKRTYIPWNEIDEVRMGTLKPSSSTHGRMVFEDDGYHLWSRNNVLLDIEKRISKRKEWETLIQEYSTDVILPRIRSDYESLGRAQFGGIVLDRYGLSKDDTFYAHMQSLYPLHMVDTFPLEHTTSGRIPWEEITGVAIQDSLVFLQRMNRRQSQIIGHVCDIPNFFVLREFVAEIVDMRTF